MSSINVSFLKLFKLFFSVLFVCHLIIASALGMIRRLIFTHVQVTVLVRM